MKEHGSSLQGPVTFAVILAFVFGLLALFCMDGHWWCGVLLAALLGILFATVIVVQWTTFRVAIRTAERVRMLEGHNEREEM